MRRQRPKKRYYLHMSSVHRAIKRFRPKARGVVVFREWVEGRLVYTVWL